MESSSESPTTIPIAHLNPALDRLTEKSIRAVVTLVWPYSSSTRCLGLLLSEPDFRLRRIHGQVKVTFRNDLAERVANTQLGIGDEVRLELRGARFVDNASVTQTPGRSVAWDLQYDDGLFLEVLRSSKLFATVNVETTAPSARTPQDARDAPATPAWDEKLSNGVGLTAWESPAFVRPARMSFGGLVNSVFDPFAEEDGFVPGKGRKRPRFSLRSAEWRVVDEPESPDGADTLIDWTDMDVDKDSEHEDEDGILHDKGDKPHVGLHDAAPYQPSPGQFTESEDGASNDLSISATSPGEREVLSISKSTVTAPAPVQAENLRHHAADDTHLLLAEPPDPQISVSSAVPASHLVEPLPNIEADDARASAPRSAFGNDLVAVTEFVRGTTTPEAAEGLHTLSEHVQNVDQSLLQAVQVKDAGGTSSTTSDLQPVRVDQHVVPGLEQFASNVRLRLGHEEAFVQPNFPQVKESIGVDTDTANFRVSVGDDAEKGVDEIDNEGGLENKVEKPYESDHESDFVEEVNADEEEEVKVGKAIHGKHASTSPGAKDETVTRFQEREVIELSDDESDDHDESAESERSDERDFTDDDEYASDEDEEVGESDERNGLRRASLRAVEGEVSGPDNSDHEEEMEDTRSLILERQAVVRRDAQRDHADGDHYSSEAAADVNESRNGRATFPVAGGEDVSSESGYNPEEEAEGTQAEDYDEDEDDLSQSSESEEGRSESHGHALETAARESAGEDEAGAPSSYISSADEVLQSARQSSAASDAPMEEVSDDVGLRSPVVAAKTSVHHGSFEEDDEASEGLVAHEESERAVEESWSEDQYASDDASNDEYDSDEVSEQSARHNNAFQQPKTVHPEVIVLDSDSEDEVPVHPQSQSTQPIAEEMQSRLGQESPRDAVADDSMHGGDTSQSLDKSPPAIESDDVETSEQDMEDGVGSHREVEDYASYASVTDLNDEVHHIEMDASFAHTSLVDRDSEPRIAAPEEFQDGKDVESVAIDPSLRIDHAMQEEHLEGSHAPHSFGQSVDSDAERAVDTKEVLDRYDPRLMLDGAASPPLTQEIPEVQFKTFAPVLPRDSTDTPGPTQETTRFEDSLPASLDTHILADDSSPPHPLRNGETHPKAGLHGVRKDEERASIASGVSVREGQFKGVVIERSPVAHGAILDVEATAIKKVENLPASLMIERAHARETRSSDNLAEEGSSSDLDVSSRESSPVTHDHEEPDRYATGLRTRLSYFAPLATLIDHFNASVDTISIVHKTSPIIRASAGKKDYIVSFQITDPSMAGTTLTAQILRPHKSSVPSLRKGDAILLRDFRVKSFNHSMALASAESSAWAVFDGSGFKVTGPPVEYGPEELAFATGLRGWYQEDGAAMVADHQLQASIERALELDESPGAGSSVAPSETGSEYSTARGGRHGSTGSRRAKKTHRQSAVHELRDGTRYVHDRDEVHELRDGTMY